MNVSSGSTIPTFRRHVTINIYRDQVKKDRWVGHVARMGEKRNVYRILVGKPEGRRPLGRPRRRWADNIKIDLRERMGWYWQDRSDSG
jgi:hypothetical protein